MRKLVLRYLAVGAMALPAMLLPLPLWSASAAAPPQPDSGAAACQLPPAHDDDHPLANREEDLERYGSLPQHCLKALVIACGEAAGQELLDLGRAAECSIGYEALLQRGFDGNFKAMVAWWQSRDGGQP